MNALVEEFNSTHPGQVDFVAVPTNQFGLQEPGSNEEIPLGLEHVRPGGGFKALYKIGEKNEVNGAGADPLFVWLKSACLAPQRLLGDPGSFYFTPIANDDITWNFEKFLLDQNGKPIKRYTPDDNPLLQMRTDILELLGSEEAQPEVEEAQPEVVVHVDAPSVPNDVVKPAKPHHRRRQPKRVHPKAVV